jgi:homoserine kinase type II
MAVYTQVPSETLAAFLTRFDVGVLVAQKGIAEGVENSNYLVDTSKGRFLLTLYEKRVDADDLPFFLDLLEHLARRGNPVPRALPGRGGQTIHQLAGRPACLIEFLPGISASTPTPVQARHVGAALGKLHGSLQDFAPTRANTLGPDAWQALLDQCGADLDDIAPGLFAQLSAAVAEVVASWPGQLPLSVIHGDLFPDNVLMLDDQVSGLIDFYFACTDVRAYDLAVTHTAWSFDTAGERFDGAVGDALVHGYTERFALTADECAALPVLARGACLRFTLTRAWDWLNTPAGALVTRKDPLAYWRRYLAYTQGNLFA